MSDLQIVFNEHIEDDKHPIPATGREDLRCLPDEDCVNVVIRPTGRGHFAAFRGQRLICKSKTPFFSAARVLQNEGVPDCTQLTMRHEGSSTVALRSTVGRAARRIVLETDRVGPRFKRYRPMSSKMPRQGVRHKARTATSNAQGASRPEVNQNRSDCGASPLLVEALGLGVKFKQKEIL